MKKIKTQKLFFTIGTVIILSIAFLFIFINKTNKYNIIPNDVVSEGELNEDIKENIEDLISSKMLEGKIPGLSIAVVKGEETLYKSGFGYADVHKNIKATSETLYQIASNSKAFTALGILQLENDNLINLNDNISKYIPWLKFYYQGKETDITISELLHHTSGISSATIYLIPRLDEENNNAIEKTIKKINNSELANRPGTKYEYATINYDVLGLLIKTVSGMSYEEYIQSYVLDTASLNNTCMYKSKVADALMSKGYKLDFLSSKQYAAPWYEGNKPAGYILSNADDMAVWLKIQMNSYSQSSICHEIIEKSHIPDLSVNTFGEKMSYAAGWIVYENAGTEIFHSGSNPNFSSFIVFRPEEKYGVAVLCNIKTTYAMNIAQSIIKLISKSEASYTEVPDLIQYVDMFCTALIFILLFFILINMYKLIIYIISFLKKRNVILLNTNKVIKCIATVFVFCVVGYLIYALPELLFNKATWGYLVVWYPFTIKPVLYLMYTLLLLLLINRIIKAIQK